MITNIKQEASHEQSIPPLITVVTVVYNDCVNIEETMNSVINQNYSNVEYIVIDGGSTDGTVEKIKKYEKHIPKWISEKDCGIYDAMNKGIKNASGKYMHFLNSGDKYYNDDVLCDLKKLFLDDIDIIYGDNMISYDNCFNRIRKVCDLNGLWMGMKVSHQSMLFKTELLKKRAFQLDYKLASDYEYLCFAVYSGYKIVNSGSIISKISSSGQSDIKRDSVANEFWRISKMYNKCRYVDLYYMIFIVYTRLLAKIKSVFPRKVVLNILKMKYLQFKSKELKVK